MTVIVTPGPISDEFVFALTQAIPDYAFERDDDGRLTVTPVHTSGSPKSGEAYYQIRTWMERTGIGGMAFASSAGFVMPSGALRSPDAAWISDERIASLAPEQRTGYWTCCPDVVIEVASPSDRWQSVVEKVASYGRAGAVYAIAIDPQSRMVHEVGIAPAGLSLDIAKIMDS